MTTARTISRTTARTPTTAPTAGAAIFCDSDISGCVVTREVNTQFENQLLNKIVEKTKDFITCSCCWDFV